MNQNINLSFDPYEVLQIDRSASVQDIKNAYRFLARQYHPDKGGNPAMWNMLTQSYQTVLKQKQRSLPASHPQSNLPRTPQQALQQREKLTNELRGNLNPDEFQGSVFNAQFASLSQNEVDFVYGVDDSIYQPRNLADYKRERESVTKDLGRIQPIFNKGKGFDPNTFNRIFEKLKKKREQQTKDLVPYQEPQAMVSQNQVAFSNLNPHASARPRHDISTSDLQQNFCELEDQYHAQSFQNPYKVSRRELEKHKHQPDITQITAMKQQDLKKRIAERNSQNISIPRGQAPPTGDLDYVFDGFDRSQQEQLNQINQSANQLRIGYTPHNTNQQSRNSPRALQEHQDQNSHLNQRNFQNPHQAQNPNQAQTYQANNPQNTYRSNNDGQLPHPALNFQPQVPDNLPLPPQNSNFQQNPSPFQSISQEPVIQPNYDPNPQYQEYQPNYQQNQQNYQQNYQQTQQNYQQTQQNYQQTQQNYQPNQNDHRLQEMERKMQEMQKTIRVQDKLIRKINRQPHHRHHRN